MSKKADSSGIREGRSQTGIFSPGLLFKPTTVKKSNSPPHRGGDLYASTSQIHLKFPSDLHFPLVVTRTTDEEAADPWFNPNSTAIFIFVLLKHLQIPARIILINPPSIFHYEERVETFLLCPQEVNCLRKRNTYVTFWSR